MSSEVVLIVGFRASGKSRVVKEYVKKGYHEISSDSNTSSFGKTLLALMAYKDGHKKIVIDGDFLSIDDRLEVIKVFQPLKIPIKCVWIKTSVEKSQFNHCFRMVEKYGKLLSPEEMRKTFDPNIVLPSSYRYSKKKFEIGCNYLKNGGSQYPKKEEGFSKIEEVELKFNLPKEYKNKAVIFDFDDTLRKSNGPNNWPELKEEVEILPKRSECISLYKKLGYTILGASNQSCISKGTDEKNVVDCFKKTLELLGFDFDYMYCKHSSSPVVCYCRKPNVGMGVSLIHKYKLDPGQCMFVGDSESDKIMSETCGFTYIHPKDFF